MLSTPSVPRASKAPQGRRGRPARLVLPKVVVSRASVGLKGNRGSRDSRGSRGNRASKGSRGNRASKGSAAKQGQVTDSSVCNFSKAYRQTLPVVSRR